MNRLVRILWLTATLCLTGAAHPATSIRILNAYQDSSVGTTLGGSHVAIVANMAAQTNQLNQALSASGASFAVTLVGSVKAATLSGSSVSEVLVNAYDNWSILAARDAVQADVSMVFVHFPSDPYDGLTLLPSVENGMSVVNVRGLGRYAYQHEFGHMLGADHQDAGGITGNYPGGPNWAHGFYDLYHYTYPVAHDSCSHTIMAYPPLANWQGYNCGGSYNGQANTSQRLVFSNINSQFQGDAQHNNTRQMILTAPVVATWHATKLYKGPAIMGAVLNLLLLTE